MFKVGDKVRVIKKVSLCSKLFANKITHISRVYTYDRGEAHHYMIECNEKNGIWPDELELYKECITEKDFLDAFQRNFKES